MYKEKKQQDKKKQVALDDFAFAVNYYKLFEILLIVPAFSGVTTSLNVQKL